MLTIQALGVSEGLVKAKAFVLAEPDLTVTKQTITDVAAEQARVDNAISTAKAQIEAIMEEAGDALGDDAEIFEAHLMMIEDEDFIEGMKNIIEDEKVCAEYACKVNCENFQAMFRAMDSEYMQARAADVGDISMRVLKVLKGISDNMIDTISEPCIIVANDLTPSDTAKVGTKPVMGFITEIGGRTSHSAIMARSMGLPAAAGAGEQARIIKNGDYVLLDGCSGEIVLNPEKEIEEEFDRKKAKFDEQRRMLETYRTQEGATSDGHRVIIEGNIGTPADAERVDAVGGEGVGLFRSEFLFMDRSDLPGEDEQFEAYKKAAETMTNRPVIIRTLDIGGDKEVPALELEKEQNPFLGYRAIRLCLKETDIFRTQLRALCRASVYGKLCIMFPMIATVKEFCDAKAIYEDVKAELIAEGVAVADNIEVGMMVEIPAAAVLADQFAKYADFFSIGTNDLIQYSMAADRMSEHVSYLYQPYNPSVLRLIANTIKGAHSQGKWAGMCGAMAGEPNAVPILLGLGLDEFSMSATQILKARKVVKSLSYAEMQELAQECLNKETMEEVLEYVTSKVGE